MTPFDVLVSFCVNIAASVFYGFYNTIIPRRRDFYGDNNRLKDSFEAEIREYFKAKQTPPALIALENFDVLKSFLNSPRIHNFFEAYMNYILKGSHYSELLVELKLPLKGLHVSDEKIIEYLTDNFVNACSGEFSDIGNYDWSSVWRHIIGAMNSVMMGKLAERDIPKMFLSHVRMDKSMDRLIEAVKDDNAKMYDNILHLFKYPFVKSNDNYEMINNRYKNILKDNFNTAHIYLLGEFAFDKFYVAPDLLKQPVRSWHKDIHFYFEEERYTSTSESWKNIFFNNNIVYVVGGAGYGKSLFLRNLIINHEKLDISNANEYLPIFCDLKNYLATSGKNRPLVDFFQEAMISTTGLQKEELTTDFINYYLDSGRCLILLDALDEVPKELRYEMHKTIISNLKNAHPFNRVCITSRIRGFEPISTISIFDIPPLSKNQVETYIDNIIALGDFKPTDKDDFLEQAKGLIDKRFLNSFLVLSLLVNIYRAERELPGNKLDLYAKCFEYIAHKREKEKDKSKKQYNWDKINPLMKDNTFISLAFLCFPNNHEVDRKDIIGCLNNEYQVTFPDAVSCENAIIEFLDFCSDRTELFVPTQKEDSFKFFHRSFFEYFYSLRIFLETQDVQSVYEQFTQFDVDSEVFELTVSAFKQRRQTKYVDIVDFIFDKAKEELSSSTFVAFNILTLLITQIAIEPVYQEEYVKLLVDYSGIIANPHNKKEGLKNADIIIALCESDKQIFSRVINAYTKYIDRDILTIITNIRFEALKRFEEYDIQKLKERNVFDLRHFSLDNETSKFIRFYMLLLNSDITFSKIIELTVAKDNPVRHFTTNYGMSMTHVGRCKRNLSFLDKLDEPKKMRFAENLVEIFQNYNFYMSRIPF